MKFLLDTHALLWWLADDDQLGTAAREVVADPANDILISMVSLWEIVVKVRIGKLQADIEEIYRRCPARGVHRARCWNGAPGDACGFAYASP